MALRTGLVAKRIEDLPQPIVRRRAVGQAARPQQRLLGEFGIGARCRQLTVSKPAPGAVGPQVAFDAVHPLRQGCVEVALEKRQRLIGVAEQGR